MKTKYMLAALTASTMLCANLPAGAADVPMCEVTMLGDANVDDDVTISDIVKLNRYLMRQDDTMSVNADLDGDGVFNIVDLCLLKRMLMGTYVPQDFTKLRINEVCASNDGCMEDPAGNTPDWVELYNDSETDIDLSGYGLSDGKKNLFKLTFPEATVIPAGGYLVVCCDSAAPTVEGALYAPFSISASGETIYLTHPTRGTLDAVDALFTKPNVTYGCYPSNSDTFSHLSATPGESNDTAVERSVVQEPTFSMESGFYDAEFDLSITGAEDCTIYYTLDNTDPRTSTTAALYDANDPILIYNNNGDPNLYSSRTDIVLYEYGAPYQRVDKGVIVRAAAKDADGNYSDVITKSYFINKSYSFYKNMKVISISTEPDNLFSDDEGIYVVGDYYYEWLNSDAYEELESWDTRNPTNYNQSGIEWERPASVQIFENGTLAYTSEVGIRIAGNATRSNTQKSFRLYARSEYGDSKLKYDFFDGMTDVNGEPITKFDKMTIRNGGNDVNCLYMRDELIQELVADRAVAVQGSEPCILFLDGEFWGLYQLKERLEDDYVESHYGILKEEVTTVKWDEVEGSDTVFQSYVDFYDWAVNADLSLEENYQKVCEAIDMQSFMDYFAIESYIANADWITSTYTNNWMMWRSNTIDDTNPYADGKWRFMLYDMEYSSGLYDDAKTRYNCNTFGNMMTEKKWNNLGALFFNLMNNETFKETFYQNYLEIMENNFDPELVDAKITEYANAQRIATLATYDRFLVKYDANLYDYYLDKLRTFYQRRPEYAKQYLDQVCGYTEPPEVGGNMVNDADIWLLYKETATGDMTVTDANTIVLNTTATGAEVWEMQAMYGGLTLEEGKTYQITYTLRSDTNGTIAPHVQQFGSPYDTYFWKQHTVTPTAQTYTYTFTMPVTNEDTKVAFDAGYGVGTFYISDISLVCIE